MSRILALVACILQLYFWSHSAVANFVPKKSVYTIGVLGSRQREDLFEDFITNETRSTHGLNISFRAIRITILDLFTFMENEEVDFIYTVPTQLSCMMSEFDVYPIATRINIRQGVPGVKYGSIIYAKKDRDDINTLDDLIGKRLIASSITGTGACQIPWKELENNGISMMMDAGQVLFSGGLQAVADGVRDGYGDAGFGTMTVFDDIENHSWADYKIIGQKEGVTLDNGDPFPFFLSTDLYPEWTLGACPWVELEVAQAVQVSFMNNPDHPAMANNRLAGFASPVSQTVTRNMQISIGTMTWNPDKHRHTCLRATELYPSITCPEGSFKLSQEDVEAGCAEEGLSCPEGYIGCICHPCKKAAEVEVYPRFANGTLGAPCAKMTTCTNTEQTEEMEFQVTDYAFRGSNQLSVTLHKRAGKETRAGVAGPKNGTFLFTFQDVYEGNVLVEVQYGSEQLLASPFFVEVQRRRCQEGYEPDEMGECKCESGTMHIGGDCVQTWVLICAIVIPLLILLACFVFCLIRRYKRKADGLWLIPFSELKFHEPVQVLGRGSFGMVIKGEYRGTVVAVKRAVPKDSNADKSASTKLFDAANEMHLNRLSICAPPEGLERLSTNEDSPEGLTMHSANGNGGSGPQPQGNSGSGPQQLLGGLGDKRASQSKSASSNPGLDSNGIPSTWAGSGVRMSGGRSVGGSHDVDREQRGSGGSAARPGAGPGSMWSNKRGSPKVSRMMNVVGSTALGRATVAHLERQKMLARFVEEMRFLSKLRHPCITTVMGAVVEKHVEPMLVMELMTHGSLFDLINNNTIQLEAEMILPILTDVVQGMRFLHSASVPVLHGDLKAQNILVDQNFRAKVTDFGLTQKKDLGLIGTPYWMPPEILRGGPPSKAADVYAFGVVLFQATSRKEPYEDEDYETVMDEILDDARVPPKNPGIPLHATPTVAEMMRQCWSREPAKRPSFEELDATISRLDLTNITSTALQRIKQQNEAAEGANAVLFDVFPKHVAEALVRGQQPEPDEREVVTIFFSDIVGFTTISSTVHPSKVSNMLHRLYTCFDRLSVDHDVFKVETIGDAYMAVTNLVKDQENDHAARIARFAIAAVAAANETAIDEDDPSMGTVQIRVGFHSGPCVAHVVGLKNPRYCLFGDTVNTASRMESNSVAGRIHCSSSAARHVRKQATDVRIESRGVIEVKGKGRMHTYWVRARTASDLNARTAHQGPEKSLFGAAGAEESGMELNRLGSGGSMDASINPATNQGTFLNRENPAAPAAVAEAAKLEGEEAAGGGAGRTGSRPAVVLSPQRQVLAEVGFAGTGSGKSPSTVDASAA